MVAGAPSCEWASSYRLRDSGSGKEKDRLTYLPRGMRAAWASYLASTAASSISAFGNASA